MFIFTGIRYKTVLLFGGGVVLNQQPTRHQPGSRQVVGNKQKWSKLWTKISLLKMHLSIHVSSNVHQIYAYLTDVKTYPFSSISTTRAAIKRQPQQRNHNNQPSSKLVFFVWRGSECYDYGLCEIVELFFFFHLVTVWFWEYMVHL